MEDLPLLDPLSVEQQEEIRTVVAQEAKREAKRTERKTGKKSGRLPCCDEQYRCKCPSIDTCSKCCGEGYAPDKLRTAFKQHLYARKKRDGGAAADYAIEGLFESPDGKTKYFGDCAPHCPARHGGVCLGVQGGRVQCPASLGIPPVQVELVPKDAAQAVGEVREAMAGRLGRLSQPAHHPVEGENLAGIQAGSGPMPGHMSEASAPALATRPQDVGVAAVAMAETLEVGGGLSFNGEEFPSPDIINGFGGSHDHKDSTELSDVDDSDPFDPGELDEVELPVGSVSHLTRGLSANGAEPGI